MTIHLTVLEYKLTHYAIRLASIVYSVDFLLAQSVLHCSWYQNIGSNTHWLYAARRLILFQTVFSLAKVQQNIWTVPQQHGHLLLHNRFVFHSTTVPPNRSIGYANFYQVSLLNNLQTFCQVHPTGILSSLPCNANQMYLRRKHHNPVPNRRHRLVAQHQLSWYYHLPAVPWGERK